MDADLTRWVLEFLLRQAVEDRLLNALLRVLPVPNDDLNLKKAMLLRRIESEIAKGSVTEKILEMLERIEELDYGKGAGASEAIKGAYCSVAVDCTVRFLDESEDKGGRYFDVVKRIWRGRVWKMEKLENAGLISDELRGWKDDIEAAVWDKGVCEIVRLKSRGTDAVEAVRAYVAEAWERMGPSFLEFVAGTVNSDTMRELLGLGKERNCDQVGNKAAGFPYPSDDMVVSKDDREMQNGVMLPRRKHVANKRTRGLISGSSRGVKITDTEGLDTRKLAKNYDGLPSPEINKVQEELRNSSLALQAVVKDPLPDALRLAENVISSMSTENINQKASVGGQGGGDVDAANTSVNESAEAAHCNRAHLNNNCSRYPNNGSKPSLMARNSTARTDEWEDSIDASPEGSPDHVSRPQLPTPGRRLVSPLKKYQIKKYSMRRKPRKWSTLEEDTLRTAVQKYGKGNWKLILCTYRDIFEERTEVDLKDKWRNMIRY